VIFPTKDPITALLLTYVMIPIGMLARPIGALFFGYLGDTFGRKIALFWSLLGMGLISLIVGVFPANVTVSFLPPLVHSALPE
jgi:MHS family metabolite:H+ symporter-like MFS transporter